MSNILEESLCEVKILNQVGKSIHPRKHQETGKSEGAAKGLSDH